MCRNINTAKVDEAAANGASKASCVMRYHGTKFNCGSCRQSIDERLAAITMLACAVPSSSAATVLLAAE